MAWDEQDLKTWADAHADELQAIRLELLEAGAWDFLAKALQPFSIAMRIDKAATAPGCSMSADLKGRVAALAAARDEAASVD